MTTAHNFHIPVMGIGFTIDTPLKVSQYGIDSVISLVDDILLEKLRKMYASKNNLSYQEITDKMEDFRAKRITSYLDLIHRLAQDKFEQFKNTTTETAEDIKKYFNALPDSSTFKQEYTQLIKNDFNLADIKKWVKDSMPIGSIDVNIMTKVDKDNYDKKEKLPSEYNDAHAALRGYANSTLNSSVVLSAGMNPRLYSYMEQFEDFYPNTNGIIKKKIVLKVSDYRSALIQGKFLAKKGLWVSEYRIESGLNCGGHAFATDGYLMGPILQQFKENKEELIKTVHELLIAALESKERACPKKPMALKISAQGGVGTAEEHHFLMSEYNVDSVGWGSAFLLVPEATTVDKDTLDKLVKAKEDDLYLSNISPLGIPFHSLKGNTKDVEKEKRIIEGKPGSPCPKKFVALNKDFKEKGLCTASRQYQSKKVEELISQNLPKAEYDYHFNKITEKSCTCVGLGTSALLVYNLDTKIEGEGVSICPGPNLAYFSKIATLEEMIGHIYGRNNVIQRTDRPNMFIKELLIYLEYYKEQIDDFRMNITDKSRKQLVSFGNNLNDGITYYQNLFQDKLEELSPSPTCVTVQLDGCRIILNTLQEQVETAEKKVLT
ncbi:hypothetical protein [Maribacter hydrothermalis]|uniref:Uncharacterized protein n=1 Tax=Maribacter hydrothermalis TaxID=1836467 RepID=A0A1B7YZ79_9FLAO|nr:hypothetical protein [Maribacter hydrothermalis]APQ19201.1 hypothetical protein BTR34_01305 [Maribacter hydrothermalis]OBR35791.1 hypothetical protein A9200_11205 [Maribacter hydrothermalis]